MGLDSVDILVRVEKTFNISIPDQEAEKIRTIGDFHNSVWKHLNKLQANHCTTQALFYKFRNSICSKFSLPKPEFTTITQLNSIIPRNNRRARYLEFQKETGLVLPDLTFKKTWSITFNTLGILIVSATLITAFVLNTWFHYSGWLYLTTLLSIFVCLYISKLLYPFRTEIVPHLAGEYTQKLLELNFTKVSSSLYANRIEVELIINQIVADQAGLELSEISKEKIITDDLGID